MGLQVNPSLKKYVDDLVAAAMAANEAYTDTLIAAVRVEIAAAIVTANSYTNAQIAAAFDPSVIAGNSDSEGYTALHNGLILKWGKTGNIAGTGFVDIAHGMTKCFQAFVTLEDCAPRPLLSPMVDIVDDTKFRINNGEDQVIVCRWFCIGR